jgi:hypothetical protein
MKRIIFIAVMCAYLAVPSLGDMITEYTDEATFTALLKPGYYLEDWNYDPWREVEPEIPDNQVFSQGDWSYSIMSPGANGLSGQPFPDDDDAGAVAPYRTGAGLKVTFTGTLPMAVGGIFWITDINGHFLDGQTVTITLDTGETHVYSDSSDWDAFTGYISDTPIASMTLTGANFVTMDHLYVGNPVPVPAAVILGILGLGVAGWKLRKYA